MNDIIPVRVAIGQGVHSEEREQQSRGTKGLQPWKNQSTLLDLKERMEKREAKGIREDIKHHLHAQQRRIWARWWTDFQRNVMKTENI